MCLNMAIRLREDILPDYQYIKRHSEFQEYSVSDCSHPSYCWNEHTYNFLRNSLVVALKNDTYFKYSILSHFYKVVVTHYHEITGCIILSRLIHIQATHIGEMNGYFQYELATLEFNNGEQLEYFHSRILRIWQEIKLSG